MRTKQEAIKWINNSIGKQYDFDGYFGFQCVDYSNAYWNYVTGGRLAGEGAKDLPFWNDFKGVATVYKNTPSFLAQAGDIVVWGSTFGNGFGHTAVVIDANSNYIVVVEQNWLLGGWTQGDARGGTGWEKATKRVHDYDTDMWFIRPKFKNPIKASVSNTVKKATSVTKKKAPAKKTKNKRIKAWSKTPHYKGVIKYNASLRQRAGSNFDNFNFNKEIGIVYQGETVYIFEEIQDEQGNIWCRTYSPSNNGWVHKHTIV